MFVFKGTKSLWPWRVVPALAGVVGVVSVMGAGACTVFNAFGEVLSVQDGSTEAGEAGSAEGGDAGTAFDSGFPDKGAIVISGRVANDAGNLVGVLTAIDPVTGNELPNARQTPINVPVVLYDGKRDLWLYIETGGSSLFPVPSDSANLHLSTLDPVSGTWKEKYSLAVPTPVFGLAAVVTNRLVYVGFSDKIDSGLAFVTIDTTDPQQPNIYSLTAMDVQPFGLMATRNGRGNGGDINMLLAETCPDDGGGGGTGDAGADASGGLAGGECLGIQHVQVPTDPDPATLTFHYDFGPFFGKPAFGSYLTGAADMILWSLPGGNASSPGPASLNSYSPQNEQPTGSPIAFTTHDGFFQPLAFAECQQQALIVATNEDLGVYAQPLSAPTSATRVALDHSGQSVYFEPYTSTVLAPFTQGDGYEFSAFTLSGTAASPMLAPRTSDWNPPADVRPEVLAIRSPFPVKCPP
jgi:hypothetical protein